MIVAVLFVSACSASTNSNPGPTKTSPAITDSGVLAEGHLEPIHYTDLALNASGLVSEVLFKEGDKVVVGPYKVLDSLKHDQKLKDERESTKEKPKNKNGKSDSNGTTGK